MKVKASDRVRTFEVCVELFRAGEERILEVSFCLSLTGENF